MGPPLSLVGSTWSRGNVPGGGRGGAPGSSQILVSLIAFGEISLFHYLEADELFLIGQFIHLFIHSFIHSFISIFIFINQ